MPSKVPAFKRERVRQGSANYKALDGLLHNQLAAIYLQERDPPRLFTLATNLPVAGQSDRILHEGYDHESRFHSACC